MKEYKVKMLKDKYKKGTRIKLINMEDSQSVPRGAKGTIDFVDDIGTIFVNWDNGSSLGLIYGVDNFEIIYDKDFKSTLVELKKIKKQLKEDKTDTLTLHICNRKTGNIGVASFCDDNKTIKIFEGNPDGSDDKVIGYKEFINDYEYHIGNELENVFENKKI